MARALEQDPPLPGEPSEGWAGLEPQTEAAPNGHARETEADGHGAEPSVVYACPMHPDVTSHEPGRCPKCGMKLEKRP